MAAFSVPAEPDFNVSHVEQVKQSDYVEASLVNGFFTNAAKFKLPNKQLPYAGKGSSAHGFTPAYSTDSSSLNKL